VFRKLLPVGSPALKYIRGWTSIIRFRRLYRSFLSDPRRFTNQDAQPLLRQAFLASKGDSLQWALRLQQRASPATAHLSFYSALFPALDEGGVEEATKALRNDGFYVLPWKISPDWLDAITKKAMTLDVVGVRGNDIQKPESIQPTQAVYHHHPQDLAILQEVKELALDPGISRIATVYFECEPVIDCVSAWWTFPLGGAADPDAAQLYHYDLDRIRWLQVFVYLTDVDKLSGPHAFIRGSHRTIGSKISRDDRHSDDEVFSMYPRIDEVVFVAPRGTVILEDTLGFHKGLPAVAKHRFMFELELSVNHFGYPYEDLGFGAQI
jgi:hypothetical protein